MIYFCIPALNEERTVGVVLWKLRQVMTELQRDFQIIVVDDASTDATQQVLHPYARVLPLTLIRNEKQLGYAASLEIAIREAVRRSPYPKRDALITLQADFTEDPDCVPALVKRVEAGADLVTCVAQMDEGTPKPIKRARRLFNWLIKGREWSQLGDPFCGLRAYRVMTIKRALETRGSARLVSWEGWAGSAELLALTMPHSRRNDIVETTLHYKRLQRPSRFRFFAMLSQVMGMRSGKPAQVEPVSLPDTTIVVPAALAVELATSRAREESRRRHTHARREEQPRGRREPRARSGQPRQRDESRQREGGERTRPQRPPRPPRPEPAPAPVVEAASDVVPAPERDKKRRRPRRRSRKKTQRPENGATEVANEPAEVSAAPTPEGESDTTSVEGVKKKSRRGRRGGRGRRRSPRPNGEETSATETQGGGEEQSTDNAS